MRALAARVLGIAASPKLAAAVFLLAAGCLIVAGVYELWGKGWALIAGGMMLAYPGIVLVRGLTRGG